MHEFIVCNVFFTINMAMLSVPGGLIQVHQGREGVGGDFIELWMEQVRVFIVAFPPLFLPWSTTWCFEVFVSWQAVEGDEGLWTASRDVTSRTPEKGDESPPPPRGEGGLPRSRATPLLGGRYQKIWDAFKLGRDPDKSPRCTSTWAVKRSIILIYRGSRVGEAVFLCSHDVTGLTLRGAWSEQLNWSSSKKSRPLKVITLWR